MDAVTFGDREVIALAETRYFCVRVDADRRPDLNERYNLGGWPTTALLTPDGHLLSGGTYLGPEEMLALMQKVAEARKSQEQEIRERSRTSEATVRLKPGVRLQADEGAVAWYRALLMDLLDREHGGLGRAPKSPHAAAMQFALALAEDGGDEAMRETADLGLGGIDRLWDQDHGGFFRY